MQVKNTQYGFEYGAATIERCMSDEKKGWVYLSLSTPRHSRKKDTQFDIYVTKTGKVRIYTAGKEITCKTS